MPDASTTVPAPASRRSDRTALIAIVVALVLMAGGLAAVALTGGANGGETPVAAVDATARNPTGAAAAPASASPASPEGSLVVEEFTDPALDAKWATYTSTSPIGAKWQPSQIQVADGNLRIVGTGKNPSGAGNLSGGLCWCGPGGNQTYGRWEVRARFDAGAGYGQVIGLWPQSENEADGSITIANAREADKKTVHMYVVWNDGTRHSYETSRKGDFTGWHIYEVEWRPTFVQIKIDGQLLYDTTGRPEKVTVPSRPMHLYLQQAVGPHEGVPAANANTPAEVAMTIDWVRLYR